MNYALATSVTTVEVLIVVTATVVTVITVFMAVIQIFIRNLRTSRLLNSCITLKIYLYKQCSDLISVYQSVELLLTEF